jgi:diguanylate cyclase (GGDEF)-like protein/PAS domain S-box-containing protein
MNAELAELQAQQLVSNIKLLVVDDEPRLLASLEALLKNKDYQVDIALGGEIACQKLEQNHYDAVLLDLNMGDFDGFAVMAFMADKRINTAIVVVSGEATFDAVRKALRLGASDYVKKPYSPGELFATIDSTLLKKHSHVDSLVAIGVESSEQEAASEKQQKSNNLFSKAEQIAKVGYWEWDDLTDKCISCSEQYAAIMDMTVEQMIKQISTDKVDRKFIFEGDSERYIQVVDSAVESNQGYDIKYNCYTNAGRLIYIHEIGEPVLNDHGVPIKWVGTIQDITESKKAEEKLRRIGHYDVLTNLPNRVLLADRLSQAKTHCQRHNRSLAVAYLDLDGFKEVNDTHGHYIGDELLIGLSQRMKEALRDGDTLARIGGDEFIAVIVDLDNIEDKKPVLERLLKAAAEPVTVGDVVLQVSVSIGVTLYPQDSADADQLMRHADQAMYVAKNAGKNRYHLFDTV